MFSPHPSLSLSQKSCLYACAVNCGSGPWQNNKAAKQIKQKSAPKQSSSLLRFTALLFQRYLCTHRGTAEGKWRKKGAIAQSWSGHGQVYQSTPWTQTSDHFLGNTSKNCRLHFYYKVVLTCCMKTSAPDLLLFVKYTNFIAFCRPGVKELSVISCFRHTESDPIHRVVLWSCVGITWERWCQSYECVALPWT